MFWMFLIVVAAGFWAAVTIAIIKSAEATKQRLIQKHEMDKAEMVAVTMKLRTESGLTAQDSPRELSWGERERIKSDLLAEIRASRAVRDW